MPTGDEKEHLTAGHTGLVSRIRAVRTWSGLNQREFAERLGVSRSYLSEVEAGKGKPNVEIVVGIATSFPAIDSLWLLAGDGEMLSHEAVPDAKATAGDLDVEALATAIGLSDDYSPSEDKTRAKFVSVLYKEYIKEYLKRISEQYGEQNARSAAEKNAELLARNMPSDWMEILESAELHSGFIRGTFRIIRTAAEGDPDDEK